jgi:hypothetical protein
MTAPAERNSATTRQAALAKARQSRRPSRLGTAAGSAAKPDYLLAGDAGFPGLLSRVWGQAAAAPDLGAAVDTLLTLGGHVPADVQLRALRMADECALKVLFGRSWRENCEPVNDAGEPTAFRGEIGLTASGQVVVRVPSRGPLSGEEDLVGGVLRVAWSDRALRHYRAEMCHASARFRDAAADCRQWLAAAGPRTRDELLENLKEAARRTAPFVLYHESRQYTNFRDRNTLTGKTLWPGHPDCALSSLKAVPLDLWSDGDAVMVVCLTLLVRSAAFGRIEEANGTQLTIDHVAFLLERIRQAYNRVPGGQPVPPAATTRITALDDLAVALGRRRREVVETVQLYREIHGPLMHKLERVAGAPAEAARRLEANLCGHLREALPVTGSTLHELGASIAASAAWLARPHGEFGTGLEALVYQTVSGTRAVFRADFAMSRGLRSLSSLIKALRAQEWAEIVRWDLPHYFCCVVPGPDASRHFAGSPAQLADTAWSISSRMQYNSWHFLAGNLPKVAEVRARDYFVPPTIPDIAHHSDQHHHGHVAAKVRFSIRSPQAVEILGRTFHGFVDLRLLRCEGAPFGEQDLLAAHRASAFIAAATGHAAALAASGANIEVTAFDSAWHWATIVSAERQGKTPG